MQFYPVLLNLVNRRVVVIGGGELAHEKVRGLVQAEAQITVIAEEIVRPLSELVEAGRITHVPRLYREGDLEDAFLVISTNSDRETNARVFADANAHSIPVNAVDDPPHCSFIAPSILRRGDLTVAVSTGGKAPAVAVRLRQQMEQQIGEEYGRFLEIAGTLRAPLAARYPDFETRKRLWYEVVDSNVFTLLRAGDETDARQRIAEIMGI